LTLPLKKLKYLLATGLGSGYIPYFPGTWGSIFALVIYIFVALNDFIWLIICIVTFFIGTWVSQAVESDKGKDPGIVVIDEFVGQWVTLLFLPRIPLVFISGFFLFRIIDILKPFPARKMEDLKGGPGIMLDDLVSGIYANIGLRIILWIIS
jgi:phosphatidylglycerophosphatase A